MAEITDLHPATLILGTAPGGIAEMAITAKVLERGSQSAGAVVSGDANIVVQPVSELIHVAGLDYAGRAPDEVQLLQVFSAAVVAGSKNAESARRLISFLASDRVADAKVKNGMDLVGKAAAK